MSDNLIQLFIQSGPVAAISLVFLFYMDRVDKRTNDLIANHLKHSTEAMNKMTKTLTKLSTIIESLKKKLQ